jgi:hypothetical protein
MSSISTRPGSPYAAGSPPLGKIDHERLQEYLDSCDDILKALRRIGQLGLPDESLPLNLLGLSFTNEESKTVGLMGIGVSRFSNVFSTALASISPLKSNVRDNIQMS